MQAQSRPVTGIQRALLAFMARCWLYLFCRRRWAAVWPHTCDTCASGNYLSHKTPETLAEFTHKCHSSLQVEPYTEHHVGSQAAPAIMHARTLNPYVSAALADWGVSSHVTPIIPRVSLSA